MLFITQNSIQHTGCISIANNIIKTFSVNPASAAIYSLDTVVSILAGVGGAGAVIVIVAATTGLVGAAALTTAISMLGGPFGILGGVFVTAGLSILVYNISKYGAGMILEKIAQKWKSDGKTLRDIEKDIDDIPGYIVSEGVKEKTKKTISEYME